MPELLTQAETNRLVAALLIGRGGEGMVQDDLESALANAIRAENKMLSLALAGEIAIDFRAGDLV